MNNQSDNAGWGSVVKSIDGHMSQEDMNGFDESQRKVREVISFLEAMEAKNEAPRKPSELSRSVTELRKNMQQAVALFQDPKHTPLRVTDTMYDNIDKAKVVLTDGCTIGLVTPQGIGEALHDYGKGDVIDLSKETAAMMANMHKIRRARGINMTDITRRSNRTTESVSAVQVTVTWLEDDDFRVWDSEDARDTSGTFGSRVWHD
ncbi:hypothetical protein HBI56_074260 [Parastagonospora nodorum]|uniref:Uncharacterized protein n=2 Tax=Phaeosphaeria nodorum (strain SN15 / ATCC MYA-4574 / FGSC 10173) TaxID=321614 RepID=Q0UKK5_PHANO|nr:hypothetical protein SNOG_07709 [Parastagonospora nodorum SN15]KAH3908691.1 hypothetical protein HBH56_170720 [Parastagonospora nodorum]EAT85175.2 hypothetical protein SNOG_07709 [Parastagonospora nodorum SN15]KAH3928294.1 hypothetical protein HBH54_139280 [Parastagonospora nodorum]KAH3945321.1 hypothetical protein HBH53_144630 [Parastagonospora nodorum]KAH3984071.1 hypothetical protein HBH52_059590 [Parastagonospora nodorum]